MARLFERRSVDGEQLVRAETGELLARVPDEMIHQLEQVRVRAEVHHPSTMASTTLTAHLSGEGVTTVSWAMAVAASVHGRTVLVDANHVRPGLVFDDAVGQAPAVPGLIDVLQGTSNIADAVLGTDRPGLSVVPVGKVEPGRSIVISPARARELVEALSVLYDNVVVDAPALTASPVALSLAAATASSLLVVRNGVTEIDQVDAASAELADTNLVGVILNDAKLATPTRLRRLLGGFE